MASSSHDTAPAESEIQIQIWPIDRLVFYARNPRKNDAAVDRMCGSIREFGFKIPVLARSDGEVVDGHLRLKAARKLGTWPGGDTSAIPVILCDEWTPAQVKAFRLMVNRSVTWADWDDELLALEIQELNAADFDLSLTGFDPKEIDDLLLIHEDDDRANAVPPVPENPVSRPGDLWLCGEHRVLCGDSTRGGPMKAIVRRLLRLEVLATPVLNERGEALGDLIRARRQRLIEEFGVTFEDWPKESFAGARSIGEIILRSRQLYRESARTGSALGA